MEQVNSSNFDDYINEDCVTIVDFFATWCMPCKMYKPILERVSSEVKDVKFATLDIDESEDIAKRYRVFSVPTLVCFKSGKKIDSIVGLNPYDEVVAFANRCKNTNIDE